VSGPGARPTVTVVGLGPAGADLVTKGTIDAIEAHDAGARFLRTARHPAAEVLGTVTTFDDVYDEAAALGDVYPAIVERLVEAAVAQGAILYAVPGSPVVAERTVELLLADARVVTVVLPALSFLDLAWARLGVDPIGQGARVVDGHRFAVEAAGERGPLLVAQCDSVDVLSDVKLAIADALETRSELGAGLARRDGARGAGDVADELRVTVVQRLGLPDEQVVEIGWADLDRDVVPDHLTSLWIPSYVAPIAAEVQRFAELVATLRNECPWDREQTHESLKRHLLEETYEVLDALDHVDVETGEGYEHLEEELGDLLFQILFHATLASEQGQFTLADVARSVHDKLYSRHPHVFGDIGAPTDDPDAEQVAANWEDLKRAEKGRESIFDGVPDALPALLFSLKVQKKAEALELGSTVGAGRAGAAIPDVPAVPAALAAVEGGEPSADDVGTLLFAVVGLARRAGVDPEMALRAAASQYRDEVKAVERELPPS
jgi:tetrapyrrole methylase family protein/MazG family protein